MKKTLVLILALAMAVSMFACTVAPAEATPEDAAQAATAEPVADATEAPVDPATLSGSITVWSSGEELTRFVEGFNAIYPNIKVDVTVVPNSEFLTKLSTAISGGEAPDLFTGESDYVKYLVETPYWTDLSQFGVDQYKDNIWEYVLNIGTDSNGVTKALSWQASPGGIIYRRDIAKAVLGTDDPAAVPYIKEAQRYQPEMTLFAASWSPSAWMKDPPVYNWGKLIPTQENLRAYAHYFARFVKAYALEGVTIQQVHVQNEPVANQKFPSCMWTGEELRTFIRDYIGPVLRRECPETELWLGTINAPGCDFNRLIFDKWATEDYDYFANVVLSDEAALQFITGVSYQWGGKIAIQRTFESWWPRIRLMQSENECGFGDNTWDYALYVWTMLKHYIGNGAESYLYWNPVLEPVGRSTWGDPQNAMVTVDPATRQYVFNPDFYVMKSVSAIVQRGATRLGMRGPWAADTLAFENPDGSLALSVLNPFCEQRVLTLQHGTERLAFALEPRSVNSILLPQARTHD